MTGLRTWRWGVSLRNESTIACVTIDMSNSARAFTVPAMALGSSLAADEVRCSTIGPSARAGTNVSAPTRMTTPTSNPRTTGVGGQRAGTGRDDLLPRQRASDGQGGDGQPVTGEEHHDAERRVVEGRVRAQPRERAAVVVTRRRESYRISLNPWIPGFEMPALPAAVTTPIEVPIRTIAGGMRIMSDDIFIS